jgi:hypothetical protein
MTKFIKNKLVALVLGVMVMALGVVAPSFTNTAQAAAATTKTVYVDVERNVFSQSPILEPVKVTLDDSETILDATVQAAATQDIDVDGSSSYVSAFQDSSPIPDNKYTFYNRVNSITNGVVFRTDLPNQPIITDNDYLREKEYDGISGWMFTVNDSLTEDNGTYYTAGTSLAEVPDNAVIRWEFTAAMGADLGLADSAYLPTAVDEYGYYDWSTAVYTAPFFTRADKSELIRKIADADTNDPDYQAALTALQTLQISQDDVDAAAAAL